MAIWLRLSGKAAFSGLFRRVVAAGQVARHFGKEINRQFEPILKDTTIPAPFFCAE